MPELGPLRRPFLKQVFTRKWGTEVILPLVTKILTPPFIRLEVDY